MICTSTEFRHCSYASLHEERRTYVSNATRAALYSVVDYITAGNTRKDGAGFPPLLLLLCWFSLADCPLGRLRDGWTAGYADNDPYINLGTWSFSIARAHPGRRSSSLPSLLFLLSLPPYVGRLPVAARR